MPEKYAARIKLHEKIEAIIKESKTFKISCFSLIKALVKRKTVKIIIQLARDLKSKKASKEAKKDNIIANNIPMRKTSPLYKGKR